VEISGASRTPQYPVSAITPRAAAQGRGQFRLGRGCGGGAPAIKQTTAGQAYHFRAERGAAPFQPGGRQSAPGATSVDSTTFASLETPSWRMTRTALYSAAGQKRPGAPVPGDERRIEVSHSPGP